MQSPHLLWQHPGWPGMHYDAARIGEALARAKRAQGVVEGKLSALGFGERQALAAEAWAQEAMATSAIEGEHLDLLAVRSSVARRLGVEIPKGPVAARHVDGLLDIMDDAVRHAGKPLTQERLYGWQAALFPTGYSGMRAILVGRYRTNAMQIVSGPHGHETVHYEAPDAGAVPGEMANFLAWFNAERGEDPLLKAALAHLWFETIHPFDDGNGRVGRNIVDLCLAREAGESSRLVCISQQLLQERDAYYDALGDAQHGNLEITAWLMWFIEQVRLAWERAASVVDASLEKARFWSVHGAVDLTPRQRKAINSLLDHGPGGFEGGLNTRKYVGITGASRATASRELMELAALGLLAQAGAGRAVRYYINLPGWQG
ncbi:MAG: DUF4172 domain-containing protein [Proteobacteria bacterium]|jgi:Fic family protein|nr:DUF4172 domain-containing protein [Pseudomonadota bacterium]